ncbi:MAG: hypothetical protein AAFV53_25025 [Myxococcota bacterium]
MSLFEPADLVSHAADAIAEGPPPDLIEQLEMLAAPPADVWSTVFSARIGQLAAAAGLGFSHHELRSRLPMPAALAPEVAVWEGDTTPTWQDGVLETPKYFSFFLDTRFPAYNPNHRRKWRPHELLHMLVGFFWRPDMTRFECYLGGRLSEMLPVAHWYGFDEIFRPRCVAHVGQLLYQTHCPRCEALSAQPYWAVDPHNPTLQAQSQTSAERALSYLTVELAACDVERRTGRRLRTHHPRLDGSSDAVGHLKGHYNRLTAWSFGATIEHFFAPGVDYQPTVSGLSDQLRETLRMILQPAPPMDAGLAARARSRRILQDVGYRTFLALEWLEQNSVAEQTLLPALEDASRLCATLRDEDADITPVLIDLFARFDACAHRFPAPIAAAFDGLGYLWADLSTDAGLRQLAEGLGSAFPDLLAPSDRGPLARRFVQSAAFRGPGSLRARISGWSDDPALQIAGWVNDLPRRDEEAELFAVLPEDNDDPPPETIRLNRTLRRRRLPAAHVAAVLDDAAAAPDLQDADGHVELAAIWWADEPRLFPLDPETRAAIDALDRRAPIERAALNALLDAGVAIYAPPCRPR